MSSFQNKLQLKFQNYTVADGLCNNNVHQTFEDSRGFLWICTSNGLSKYDGVAFENFFHSAKDSNTVAGNSITSICEMSGDLIIIGTTDGLSIYNNASHRFENRKLIASFCLGFRDMTLHGSFSVCG